MNTISFFLGPKGSTENLHEATVYNAGMDLQKNIY